MMIYAAFDFATFLFFSRALIIDIISFSLFSDDIDDIDILFRCHYYLLFIFALFRYF